MEVPPSMPEEEADDLPVEEEELELQRGDEASSTEAGDQHTPAEPEEVEERDALVSPPDPEPEVPDPFLVDDPEDPVSEEEVQEHAELSPVEDDEDNDLAPADEIALAQSVAELPPPPVTPASALISTEAHPLASTVLQVNKPIPPVPSDTAAPVASDASSSSEEEDEPPSLYISGLTVPTMFLPIPNVRLFLFIPLTWWLRPRKYCID